MITSSVKQVVTPKVFAEQLRINELLTAFEAMRPPKPTPDTVFVAGNQTYAIEDFRRAADKAGGEVGATLHVLIDALEQRDVNALRQGQEKVRELRAAAATVRRILKRLIKLSGPKRALTQLLKEAHEELISP